MSKKKTKDKLVVKDHFEIIDQSTINRLAEYQAIILNSRITAFEYAVKFGYEVIAIKEKLPHGSFETWINDNITFVSYRTIRRYMQIAKNEHELRVHLSDKLDLESALSYFSKKKNDSKSLSEDTFKPVKEFQDKVKKSISELEKAKRLLSQNRTERIQEPERTIIKTELETKVEKKSAAIEKQTKTLKSYENRLQKLQSKTEKERFLKAKKERLESELNTIDFLLSEL